MSLGTHHVIITNVTEPGAGAAGISAYCASKHAVRGFMDSLRLEVYPLKVMLRVHHPVGTSPRRQMYMRVLLDKTVMHL